ncbi:uncharacterized protein BXZ73DRAFT_104642 [Epithele typhae]|uniref:uncharacterized protein n=1 Tax=Epithele typhae TaxID=378194 RepID=UPI00200866A3|nr:uncharacterized protein BXZ73DRAFT_104642 [Epithele typhae]KAH9920517.1 hypothetical protein BXZ73DRAFT_104642 [Epithele typhae]
MVPVPQSCAANLKALAVTGDLFTFPPSNYPSLTHLLIEFNFDWRLYHTEDTVSLLRSTPQLVSLHFCHYFHAPIESSSGQGRVSLPHLRALTFHNSWCHSVNSLLSALLLPEAPVRGFFDLHHVATSDLNRIQLLEGILRPFRPSLSTAGEAVLDVDLEDMLKFAFEPDGLGIGPRVAIKMYDARGHSEGWGPGMVNLTRVLPSVLNAVVSLRLSGTPSPASPGASLPALLAHMPALRELVLDFAERRYDESESTECGSLLAFLTPTSRDGASQATATPLPHLAVLGLGANCYTLDSTTQMATALKAALVARGCRLFRLVVRPRRDADAPSEPDGPTGSPTAEGPLFAAQEGVLRAFGLDAHADHFEVLPPGLGGLGLGTGDAESAVGRWAEAEADWGERERIVAAWLDDVIAGDEVHTSVQLTCLLRAAADLLAKRSEWSSPNAGSVGAAAVVFLRGMVPTLSFVDVATERSRDEWYCYEAVLGRGGAEVRAMCIASRRVSEFA